MKRIALVFALLLCACGRSRQAGPPIPFDEEGACPFQCCTYRDWSVDWDTDIHADRKDDSRIVFHAALGDTVSALTGVVTTTTVGRATASRPVTVGSKHLMIAAGEPIYLLRNVGSEWKIWINGITDEQYIPNQGYCTGGKQSSDECALTVVEQPQIVWWAKVRDAQGREGWTREVDHFGNIDSCG